MKIILFMAALISLGFALKRINQGFKAKEPLELNKIGRQEINTLTSGIACLLMTVVFFVGFLWLKNKETQAKERLLYLQKMDRDKNLFDKMFDSF